MDEIRMFRAGSLQIHRRVRSAIEDLLAVTTEERQAVLREQLQLLEAAAERAFPDEHDRAASTRADRQGLGS